MLTAYDVLVPKYLSQNELHFLCDLFNGANLEDRGSLLSLLTLNVRDSVLDGYDKKWNVDIDRLCNKLEKFGTLNFIIAYAIMEFWKIPKEYMEMEDCYLTE